jgi:hypothetical protein
MAWRFIHMIPFTLDLILPELHDIDKLIVTVFISKNRKRPKPKHKSRDKQAMQDQVVRHRLGRLHI